MSSLKWKSVIFSALCDTVTLLILDPHSHKENHIQEADILIKDFLVVFPFKASPGFTAHLKTQKITKFTCLLSTFLWATNCKLKSNVFIKRWMFYTSGKIWIRYCEYFWKLVTFSVTKCLNLKNRLTTTQEKHVIKPKREIWSMFLVFVHICFICGDYFCLYCNFLFILHLICKHFVKMYILEELFLYTIDMLYNALTFKLSGLYFCYCLVVVAQWNILEEIKSN